MKQEQIQIPPHFRILTTPQAAPHAEVHAGQARFTLLTSRLIRMEYSASSVFEDHPSQVFWHRQQPVPAYKVRRSEGFLEIITPHLHLHYQLGEPFSWRSLWIEMLETGKVWRYGNTDSRNLSGTARTLDKACGRIELEPGLLSRSGWSVVDDSGSLVFTPDGWLTKREKPENLDLYFFGYGKEYRECLADFCKVSGPIPMVPRWILGNWWSRYWAYTQDELTELMLDFQKRQVPLSVCIVDMDWHLDGWTGYTWNRELFPDPKKFIDFVHQLGLRTALNLHPAQGVGPHEAMYSQMAEAMGIDPSSQEPVTFDLEDPHFARAYFEHLHHPQEADGIDFWWMDWQQGNPCRLPGLNLLWWINHLHFLDLGRDENKRSFIFSRWGGLGNHRYPIGFSGDTVSTWESLAFQPYFTATAANVGYGWWSHDIGGHMDGFEDAEQYTRWVQYGVFSPIFRLHSTKNPFHERRPWGYDAETFRLTRQAMQLRHALIPYLYSMAWRSHQEGVSFIHPMYYLHPDVEEAYACPNQYAYGSELIAAPFTSPRNPETGLSRQVIWLPPGDWFEFFSGRHVAGGWYAVYGSMEDIPVYAKAGAIVPLAPFPDWGGVENPASFTLHVFPGMSNQFELYEDDGVSSAYRKGAYSVTRYELNWTGDLLTFDIHPAAGDVSILPAERTYSLKFHSLAQPESVSVFIDGRQAEVAPQYNPDAHQLSLTIESITLQQHLQVNIQGHSDSLMAKDDFRQENAYRLLKAFRLGNEAKKAIATSLPAILADPDELGAYLPVLTRSQMRALIEVLALTGMERVTSPMDEQVVLWNNQADSRAKYRLAMEGLNIYQPEMRFRSTSQIVPLSLVIDLEKEFGSNPGIIQLTYRDLLKLQATHAMDEIYMRPKDRLD